MVTCRQFGAASMALGAPAVLTACTPRGSVPPYDDAVRKLWRHGAVDRGGAAAVRSGRAAAALRPLQAVWI